MDTFHGGVGLDETNLSLTITSGNESDWTLTVHCDTCGQWCYNDKNLYDHLTAEHPEDVTCAKGYVAYRR